MKKYYLHNGTNQVGPYSVEELKIMFLQPSTPVWYPGLIEWTTIAEVEELKSLFGVPPPFQNTVPPEMKNVIQNKNNVEDKKNLKSKIARASLIVIVFLLFTVIGFRIYIAFQEQQKQDASFARKSLVRKNIQQYVTAQINNYTYRLIGGISNLKVTATNNSEFLIDNVKVKVNYIKIDGGIWDTKIIEFKNLQPNTNDIIAVDDTPRGVSVQYEIISIKSSELGLD